MLSTYLNLKWIMIKDDCPRLLSSIVEWYLCVLTSCPCCVYYYFHLSYFIQWVSRMENIAVLLIMYIFCCYGWPIFLDISNYFSARLGRILILFTYIIVSIAKDNIFVYNMCFIIPIQYITIWLRFLSIMLLVYLTFA